MSKAVNIVVVTFNRLENTKQTLLNIRNTATVTMPYYLTVVDNGSTDGTVEYLKDLFSKRIINNLILLKDNIGVAKGSNLGWKLFEDEAHIYAKIDNDIIFNKRNWLDEIVNVLENAPELGALGYTANLDLKHTWVATNNGKVSYKKVNGNIGGCCHFIPKHTHSLLGYWNEGFDLYGEEDLDYGIRIMFAGLKNAYMVEENVIFHKYHSDPIEYTIFKDTQREDNLNRLWQYFLEGYKNKSISLYHNTNIINECKYELYRN